MENFPSVLESISDLTKRQIDGLMELSQQIKLRPWHPISFPNKKPIIATSFLENSTRTKHSFEIAIHKMGCTYIDFIAETSSLKKGESLEQTLLTLFGQGVDLCIIRSAVSHELAQFKENPPLKIINGGDGTHQHPTQALLDLFTLKEMGIKLKGKTFCIAGDNIHSRVGHSLIDLLPMYGAKVLLFGPEEFLPPVTEESNFEITHSRSEALEKADILYLLRVQKERHSHLESIDMDNYHREYGFNLEMIESLQKKLPILHPGPANIGVEISDDLIHSQYYLGHEQVRHSTFLRMAIIQSILQNGDKSIGFKENTFFNN
ncbi:aspartate carbamoyltransferase catalytic subunit [Halobacteriovorax sp. HLS]|uniref:aspartate carbamoyltransferase catalytic subunit n=1 Tax=Halobacteriovorax sp. HLS TaxID=2234000 RepID=UPI000FDAF6D1|nr:aspartate carbamoyltransferase catalytic subunit [Halobacteriovorax sp. HLS]